MVLGMPTFTFIHVLISLAGIGSGLVVAYGLLTSKRLDAWTILFLVTTAATSVTGFLFPFHGFTPAIGVGILSMVVLIAAILALYVFRLAGAWRVVYIAGAVIALYFNVFVLIVQAFQKIAVLRDLAPTQTEPPFLIAQLAALLFFIAVGIQAVRRFHPPNHA
jgi:hypothetical protein